MAERIRKNSKKRSAILELLRQTETHPSAEWIYSRLKPEYPGLSLGTVYRNLSLFKEEGQVASVGTVQGQERFDGNTAPHAHFICERCGKVVDIMRQPVLDPGYLEAVEAAAGEVPSHQHIVYGLCRDCGGPKQ